MSHSAVCWQCGASLAELGLTAPGLPLSRFDTCRRCRAELHVCKLCKFYDVAVAKHCHEPVAEEVSDKQRANFCDYFTLRNDAYQPVSTTAAQQSRAHLDALFGSVTVKASPPELNAADPGKAEPISAADAARAALENLFGGKKS